MLKSTPGGIDSHNPRHKFLNGSMDCRQVEEMKLRLSRLTEAEVARARLEADRAADGLRAARDLSRTIVHVDMDAFYAAVEMRDDPALREVPMAVGGMGMLSTSNYRARKFGVRAGMPGFIGEH